MWDSLKKQFAESLKGGLQNLQFQNYIEQLLSIPDEQGAQQALEHLRAQVHALDDAAYKRFVGALEGMAAVEQQKLQTGYDAEYENMSFEDKLFMTTSGAYNQRSSAIKQQAQARLQGLQAIYQYAEHFRQQAPRQSAPSQGQTFSAQPAETGARARPSSPAQQRVHELKARVVEGMSRGEDHASLMPLMQELYAAEKEAGNISAERQQMLAPLLGELDDVVNDESDDLSDMSANAARGRDLIGRVTHAAVESRPANSEAAPEGSRAARLAELLKQVTTHVMAEVNRPFLKDRDQKAISNLYARCVGEKNAVANLKTEESAVALERESLRRLALDARNYSLRTHLTLARPVWPTPPVVQNPNAVFFSGGREAEVLLSAVCQWRGLQLLNRPEQKDYAQSRWNQLRESHVAVFDLLDYKRGAMDASTAARVASVCYEMGIAFALGRPVLVLARAESAPPFDVDIAPVPLEGDGSEARLIADALDAAVYGHQRGGADSSLEETLAFARRTFWSHTNAGLRVMLDVIDGEQACDGFKVRAALETVLGMAGPESPQLVNPSWPGDYPNASEPRLFHVMSFGDEWSDEASRLAERACAGKVTYVRGDKVPDPDIIRSIWNDICRATHVLVDLTGFNPNVMLELGMAHTLGRNVLLVSQDSRDVGRVPSLAKQRVHAYSLKGEGSAPPLVEVVGRFVNG